MNPKTIIRKAKNKENPYAQIAKTAVQDKRLTWKATGLLAYILSLPDDWQIYAVDLARRKADGISATRSALKELATAGYIELISSRNEKGKYIKHEHLVHENPLTTIQKTEYGFLDTTNTDLTNTQDFSSLDRLRYDTDPMYRAEFDEASKAKH